MLPTNPVRALLATSLIAALLASSGCSWMHRPDGSMKFMPRSHNSDYNKAQENRPLEVPPDLDTPATDPAMQIPVKRDGTGMQASSDSGPSFTLSDTPASSWERVGRALDHIDGVTVTQRSQLINSYEVQFKGASILLRANPESGSTRIDAIGNDGTPVRTPEAVQLLGMLRQRLG